jgi:formyltetrahydrofolate deformylase
MIARNLAVVSVIGRDQKGVVARICTYLASCNTNIEDIEQRVVEGLFIMTMVVDLADVTQSLDELILGLKEIGTEMHLEVSVRLHGERTRKRIAVLVSREPHCLQQLQADHAAGLIAGDFVGVLSNHDLLRPLAEDAGIPFASHPSADKESHQTWLLERLREWRPDLVVLARYMQIIAPPMVAQYRNRIINIHPSLLPKYPGLHTHRRALEARDSLHGASVHYVTAELDGGPVLACSEIAIEAGDDADSLAARLLPREHALLCRCVQWIAEGRAQLRDKLVHFDGAPLSETLRV